MSMSLRCARQPIIAHEGLDRCRPVAKGHAQVDEWRREQQHAAAASRSAAIFTTRFQLAAHGLPLTAWQCHGYPFTAYS